MMKASYARRNAALMEGAEEVEVPLQPPERLSEAVPHQGCAERGFFREDPGDSSRELINLMQFRAGRLITT